MNTIEPFSFKRTKGIVWVCDLKKSSSYLNDDTLASDIEAFIPRFYFVSKLLVESYGGSYLKWTGDGFLAWFEIELDRDKMIVSEKVYNAAWHMTFMSNITQFGLNVKRKFGIRHGITYEKDALLMRPNPKEKSYDIIGRAVVLAFRLSGIESHFPSIATVKELINNKGDVNFKKWIPSKEEKLKFFKGERYGTTSIYVSSKKKFHTNSSLKKTVDKSKALISKALSKPDTLVNDSHFQEIQIFLTQMQNGPDWCKDIVSKHTDFIRDNLLKSLIDFVTIYESSKDLGHK